MSHVEQVGALYAAFGRGDIPTILAALAPDVEWEYASNGAPIPWMAPRRGKAEVPGFFEVLASQLDITQFEPIAILGQGDLVVSVVDVQFKVKSTGKRVLEPEEVHLWHFNDAGQVQKFRHRADTWACVEALKRP